MELSSLESAIANVRVSGPEKKSEIGKLVKFLTMHKVGKLILAPGIPPESVGFAVTERFEMIFQTVETTPECKSLRKNPNAVIVVGLDPHIEQIRLEGLAEELKGEELEKLKILYFAVQPSCRQWDRWPGTTYFRVKPRLIRHSDFRIFSEPRIVEFNEINVA